MVPHPGHSRVLNSDRGRWIKLRVLLQGFASRLPSVARLLSMNVGVALATFLTSVLLARSLDPAGRGDLANIVLWPTFLAQIGLCGIPTYLARGIAQDPMRAAKLYQFGYRAMAISSVGTIVAYLCIVRFAGLSNTSALGWSMPLFAAVIIPFSAWNALQVQMELGRQGIGTYSWARASFAIAHFTLVAALWLFQARTAAHYLGAFVIAACFAAVSTHVVIKNSLVSVPGEMKGGDHTVAAETMTATFGAAWPFAVTTIVMAIAATADRIAVGSGFDSTTMGLYVIALALSQVQGVVNDAVSPLFFSRVAQNDQIANADQKWLGMRLRQAVLINASISASLLLAAPILIPAIYGNAYRDALQVIYLLVPAMCLRSMMQPFQEVLRGGNQPLSQSTAAVTMTGVFIVVAALAIWFHSIEGVAAALLISSFVGLIVMARSVGKASGLTLMQVVIPRPADAVGLLTEMRRLVRG
jgi:O-antigen/teichoic acid export membrane protein